jgi:hypothetical protein
VLSIFFQNFAKSSDQCQKRHNNTAKIQQTTMKLTILYLTVLTILTSCNGQTTTQKVNAVEQSDPISKNDPLKELSKNIMVVFQDSKNNYWFGSWKDGLYKYFTTEDGLLGNRIEDIKEDKLGNIYINTTNGLCRFSGERFAAVKETASADNDWKLSPDDIWFKNSGGVYRFDGKHLFRLELPKTKLGEEYILKNPSQPNPYGIYCIYKDSKGNIWFGTATLGVCRYNGKSFDWISELDITEMHNGPANGVRSIAEDKNGDFWFNTEYRYSVYNKNPATPKDIDNTTFYDRIKSIGCLDGKKDGDLNEYLSIIKDNNNDLWIATYLQGVWKYDGEKINHYPVQVSSKNISIYCLFKDNNGAIWLGTEGNGVFKFKGKEFEKF